jgi:hypothetical protein
LELKEAHPLNQLRPVVLHIADLGPDLPRLDRARIGLHQCRRLIGRAAHPIIELRVVEHDRHAVVILGDARRGGRRDDGKANEALEPQKWSNPGAGVRR